MRSATPAPQLEISEKRIATYRKIIETQALIAESHFSLSRCISQALGELIDTYESQKPKSAPGKLFVIPGRKAC
jgi:hypothetical protein